ERVEVLLQTRVGGDARIDGERRAILRSTRFIVGPPGRLELLAGTPWGRNAGPCASRSDGPLARPRSCVAKPNRSEMPNRTPWLREAASDRALRGRTRRGLATRQYRAMSPILG